MKADRVLSVKRVGAWDFIPETGELRRGEEVRRLEPRAAKALEILCDAQGALVSQEELISRVWQGRTLSENTVPVVIGQLRRALDDDAREPKLIETIPKRGYRLAAGAVLPRAQATRGRSAGWLLALSAIIAAVIVALMLPRAGGPQIHVSNVVNETGNPAVDPLARATSELIVSELGERGFAVRRGEGGAELDLAAKLVMWNGSPWLAMNASDEAGTVRWSSMTDASNGRVPANVPAELDKLKAAVAH